MRTAALGSGESARTGKNYAFRVGRPIGIGRMIGRVRLVLKLRPGSGRLEGRVGREGGPWLAFSGTLELVARLEELEELEDTATTEEEAQR